jgi:hypothetical protein
MKAGAHTIFDSAMLQQMGPAPIPVIAAGGGACVALLMIEHMMFTSFTQASKTGSKIFDDYAIRLKKALAQRAAALTKLMNDEVKAQKWFRDRKKYIEKRIPEIIQEQKDLAKFQKQEKARYDATVLEYAANAQAANAKGTPEGKAEADDWAYLLTTLDEWLVEILLITVQITDLKLEMFDLEREYPTILRLANVQLTKKWDFLNEWADDFEVPVPYYPDLPEKPAVPPITPDPSIKSMLSFGGCIPKELLKATAIWLVAPQIPPLGVPLRAVFECVRAYLAPLLPPNSQQLEEIGDTMIPNLGINII